LKSKVIYRGLIMWASVGILCSLPLLCPIVLVHFYLKSSLVDYFPSGGDAVVYWREIATYFASGLRGGYYGFEETTAPAARLGFAAFGALSQWFTIFYGLLAKVVGWESYTCIFINITLLILSLAVFLVLMRGGEGFVLFCIAVFITSIYIQSFIPIMMMESLQYSFAFLFAGLFYRFFDSLHGNSRLLKGSLWIIIMFATLTRYSWGLLFFAYYLPIGRMHSVKAWLLCLIKAICCSLAGALGYIYFSAPYPYEAFPGSKLGFSIYVSLLHGDLNPFLSLLKQNLLGLFHPEQMTAQFLLFWMVIIYSFLAPCLTLYANAKVTSDRSKLLPLAFFHVINLGGILAASFFLNSVGMLGLRLVMPHFICSLMLLARSIRLRWLVPILILQLVVMPKLFHETQCMLTADYSKYNLKITNSETEDIFKFLKYNKFAKTPWCNTVLFFGTYNSGSAYMNVPYPMSINDMRFKTLESLDEPFKSAWVVTGDEDAKKVLDQLSELELVGVNEKWAVYRNHASICDNSDEGLTEKR